jgi:hypothetical protein
VRNPEIPREREPRGSGASDIVHCVSSTAWASTFSVGEPLVSPTSSTGPVSFQVKRSDNETERRALLHRAERAVEFETEWLPFACPARIAEYPTGRSVIRYLPIDIERHKSVRHDAHLSGWISASVHCNITCRTTKSSSWSMAFSIKCNLSCTAPTNNARCKALDCDKHRKGFDELRTAECGSSVFEDASDRGSPSSV